VSLKGKLLVATPPLADPNFDRTVVLLLEHGTEGAVGLVLNRPSETPVREQLPTWADRVGEPDLLFVGGPVQEDAIIALGLADRAVLTEAFSPVRGPMGTVDLTAEPDEVGVVLQAVRVFAGYAGWGPGQLEGELLQRAWIVVDAEPHDAVSTDPSELWWTVLARQPGQLSWLSLYPPDELAN
jgi:putative transcriptional regulator